MRERARLRTNVILTGFTSFFTDISSEMIYPLLQAFVKSVLASQSALVGPVLGLIEGTAESTASLLKVVSGAYSDRIGKRKPVAISGYSLSAVSKLLYLVPLWVTVLLARFFDRVGKGVRTAPRDALIAESSSSGSRGRAFGFQRAMDYAGASLGTIFAFLLVRRLLPVDVGPVDPAIFTRIFLIALVPAFLGVFFLLFLRESGSSRGHSQGRNGGSSKASGSADGGKPSLFATLAALPPNIRIFLLSQAVFTLGNSSNQFLLLRSGELGHTLPRVLLLYIVFNLSSSLLSPVFGSLSDRAGRKLVLLIGYFLYTAVYAAFGFIVPATRALLWVFWPLYGVHYALTEGVEKAFVADLAPPESRATTLGLFNTIVGIGLFPASLIAGMLFRLEPFLPFLFGGAMSLVSAMVLAAFVRERKTGEG